MAGILLVCACSDSGGKNEPPAIVPGGVTPFVIGGRLTLAAEKALPYDGAAAFVGPGCDERDQVVVNLPVGSSSLTIMAMAAENDIIDEIIALPPDLTLAATAEECRAHNESYGKTLEPFLGTPVSREDVNLAVSREFRILFEQHGTLIARWFDSGSTCDLSLAFTAGFRANPPG